ncbi:hypothetical protein ElyMa_001519200 [Elysia marginata]|uniref:Uncharacterized protein n=1 Tax=Elysia marginata TaxID=1093978 RepID=A0AAV4J6A4_9GAST|nr:hypothetical protein ElyMa_001519200 [Elysia marginata]
MLSGWPRIERDGGALLMAYTLLQGEKGKEEEELITGAIKPPRLKRLKDTVTTFISTIAGIRNNMHTVRDSKDSKPALCTASSRSR